MADYSSLIGPVIQGAGAVVSEVAAGAKDAEARRMLELALQGYRGLEIPILEEIVAEQLGPSELGNVRGDPQMAAIQRQALAMLSDYTTGKGSAIDRAAMARIGNEASSVAAQQRHAIMDQNAQRGTYGSGGELLSMMGAGQQASQRAAMGGLDTAARAEARRYQAIGDQGAMASGIRSQQYNEDARAAQARDAVAQYNAAARQQAKQYNAGLPAQQYAMLMAKTQGQAGMLGNLSQNATQSADSTRQFMAAMSAAAARQAQEQVQQQKDAEEREYQSRLRQSFANPYNNVGYSTPRPPGYY